MSSDRSHKRLNTTIKMVPSTHPPYSSATGNDRTPAPMLVAARLTMLPHTVPVEARCTSCFAAMSRSVTGVW